MKNNKYSNKTIEELNVILKKLEERKEYIQKRQLNLYKNNFHIRGNKIGISEAALFEFLSMYLP